MKIRCDFVTNSSSTSFIAWGVEVDVFDLRKNEKLLSHIWDKYATRHVFPEVFLPCKTKDELFKDGEALTEAFEDLLEGTDLSYAKDPEVGWYLIGKSPFVMDDNQTLRDFKSGIRVSLWKIGFEKVRIKEIHESVPSG